MIEMSLPSWSRGRHQFAFFPEFASLWKDIFKNVWAQRHNQNNGPEYFGTSFEAPPSSAEAAPIATEQGDVDILAFCGEGKDNLAAMKLQCI